MKVLGDIAQHVDGFHKTASELGSKTILISVVPPGRTGFFDHTTPVQPHEGLTSRMTKGSLPVLQIRKET